MFEVMITEKDKRQIEDHGLSEGKIERQLEIFRKGIPFANVIKAAAIGDGIDFLSEMEEKQYVALFEMAKDSLDLLKFVPASGAATRMFKFLHQFLDDFDPTDDLDSFIDREENKELKRFFVSYDRFAFSPVVFGRLKKKYNDFESLTRTGQFYLFVKEMLSPDGLNYGHTPKGLIPFHLSDEGYLTAFDEQLMEGQAYAVSKGVAKLHFTVSKEHEGKFAERLQEMLPFYEATANVRFEVTYSHQKEETDTIAVNMDNSPYKNHEGKLVFRPSGHGALLENLNRCNADILFIKNIDNVVTGRDLEIVAYYKKVLAGRLLTLQKHIHHFVEGLSSERLFSQALFADAVKFVKEELHLPTDSLGKEGLLKILNRPIRVCGVVQNTGAPGGGPFFVRTEDGEISRQIVEMSQIDLNNPQQKSIAMEATHFNPVDLVCGIRDYQGNKFDLHQFANPNTGFISVKSYKGEPIKALELPGLWNGAMYNWNTVFVEVPLITFNPVKTVNDLLNEVHQQI